MAVPYSSIDRYEPGFLEAWFATVERMTRHTQFIGGEAVQKLESELAQRAGVKFARACANGTDAIQIALRAVGVVAGDRVMIPDMTFWATFESVVNVGAKPITLDIDADDLHLSAAAVEKAILEYKPKALILVHLYGWAARDTLEIREICKRHGVRLIEDSAQAWGVKIGDEPLFAGAEISTTSFYPGKVLGAAGDGGAMFTQDEDLAKVCWQLANHGRLDKYRHALAGYNSRLDSLQAAYLSLSLEHIDARLASRRQVCQWYAQELGDLPLRVRRPTPKVTENGYIAVLSTEHATREKMRKHFDETRIGYAIVYPGPMSEQPGATAWLEKKLGGAESRRVADEVINPPCFAYMTRAEFDEVKEQITRAVRS